jgi:hypothetical protein
VASADPDEIARNITNMFDNLFEKVHLDVDYQSYVRVTFLAQPILD